MEVHRTLRAPKPGPGRLRMVRIVGDGTPPNTRILDGSGEPIPELVISYSVQGDVEGCARGAFTYLESNEDGEIVIDPETNLPQEGSFEAWVVLEAPPEASKGETAENQIARLAQHILREIPGEPSEDEGAVDTAIRLLRNYVEVPVEGERYWSCKIGPATSDPGECGGDMRLREMVEDVFRAMFDKDADLCSSGWGAHLTALEREVCKNLDVGGIGTPTGPPISAEELAKLPSNATAEDIEAIRKGGGWEAPVTQEELEALREDAPMLPTGESNEKAFSRLAPGSGEDR